MIDALSFAASVLADKASGKLVGRGNDYILYLLSLVFLLGYSGGRLEPIITRVPIVMRPSLGASDQGKDE